MDGRHTGGRKSIAQRLRDLAEVVEYDWPDESELTTHLHASDVLDPALGMMVVDKRVVGYTIILTTMIPPLNKPLHDALRAIDAGLIQERR